MFFHTIFCAIALLRDSRRRPRVGLFPQSLGNRERINLEIFPPGYFISSLMQLPMVTAAERDSELITDFQTDRSWLRKSKMMRIGRLSPADEARLRCNEFEMCLVTEPFGFGNGELALVDAIRNAARVRWNKRRSQRGILFLVGSIVSELLYNRNILPMAVITGWSGNRGRVIGMKPKALFGSCGT